MAFVPPEVGMFFDLLPTSNTCKKSTFLPQKSAKYPDPPGSASFGFLDPDPYPDPHWDKKLNLDPH
jgi:hypothetical protein